MSNIITDKTELQVACEFVSNPLRGKEIADKLFEVLRTFPNGVGLAANQIGYNARVFVMNVTEPMYFVNPRILSGVGEVVFKEGCLSFPGREILTKRTRNILVRADNLDKDIFFGRDHDSDEISLESIVFQHELDHINGITMFDRQIHMIDEFRRMF
jgi:peptide deformylase